MKVALLLLVVCLAFSQSEAFFRGVGFGGRFGFGRFGFGFGRFWPWGLGLGLPYGGIIPPVPIGIGKRDVTGVVPSVVMNKTLCSYTSKKSILACNGAKFNFECDVVPNYATLTSISYRIQNLTVIPDEISVGTVEQPIFRLFSRVDSVMNNFTLIENVDRRVVFSVYTSDKLTGQTGIRIKDENCWNAFITMMKESMPETVRFALFINNVTKQ